MVSNVIVKLFLFVGDNNIVGIHHSRIIGVTGVREFSSSIYLFPRPNLSSSSDSLENKNFILI